MKLSSTALSVRAVRTPNLYGLTFQGTMLVNIRY